MALQNRLLIGASAAALAFAGEAAGQQNPSELEAKLNTRIDFSEAAASTDGSTSYDALELPEDDSRVSFFGNVSVHSKYRVDAGFTLSDGPVVQSIFGVNVADVFTEGDAVGGYVWKNFDIDRGNLSEVDLAVTYSRPLVTNPEGWNVSGDLELAIWDYTHGFIAPNHDWAFIAGLNFSNKDSPVDVRLEATQLLTSGRGREYDATVTTKPMDIGRIGDWDLAIEAYFSTARLDGFFGLDGMSNMQFGVNIETGTPISFDIEYQDGQREGFEDGWKVSSKYTIPF